MKSAVSLVVAILGLVLQSALAQTVDAPAVRAAVVIDAQTSAPQFAIQDSTASWANVVQTLDQRIQSLDASALRLNNGFPPYLDRLYRGEVVINPAGLPPLITALNQFATEEDGIETALLLTIANIPANPSLIAPAQALWADARSFNNDWAQANSLVQQFAAMVQRAGYSAQGEQIAQITTHILQTAGKVENDSQTLMNKVQGR